MIILRLINFLRHARPSRGRPSIVKKKIKPRTIYGRTASREREEEKDGFLGKEGRTVRKKKIEMKTTPDERREKRDTHGTRAATPY